MRFATRVRTEIEALDSTLAVVALPAAFSRASLARDSLVDVRANPAGGGWAIRGRGDEHWTTTAALSAFVGTETRQSSLLFPVETVTGGAAALIDHGLRTADRRCLGLNFWACEVLLRRVMGFPYFSCCRLHYFELTIWSHVRYDGGRS